MGINITYFVFLSRKIDLCIEISHVCRRFLNYYFTADYFAFTNYPETENTENLCKCFNSTHCWAINVIKCKNWRSKTNRRKQMCTAETQLHMFVFDIHGVKLHVHLCVWGICKPLWGSLQRDVKCGLILWIWKLLLGSLSPICLYRHVHTHSF